MRFSKYHGLGNDFIVVDLRSIAREPGRKWPEDPDVVRSLCERRFGIGADGVLPILPPTSRGAHARMRVLNADGSEAEMCGNGIRCVAKHLYERDPALRRSPLIIDTGAGPLSCALSLVGDNDSTSVDSVTVDMGQPRLLRGDIPMTGPAGERAIRNSIELAGQRFDLTCVSMGNPHAVTFVDQRGADLRGLAERMGPTLETHSWFPRRTNAEFAHVRSRREIELVVWERGCGITLACGTGACATAVAACLEDRADIGEEIAVHLLGGALAITVAPDWSSVSMRGPATHVFDGELWS